MTCIVQEIDMKNFRKELKNKGFSAENILEIQSVMEESLVI